MGALLSISTLILSVYWDIVMGIICNYTLIKIRLKKNPDHVFRNSAVTNTKALNSLVW